MWTTNNERRVEEMTITIPQIPPSLNKYAGRKNVIPPQRVVNGKVIIQREWTEEDTKTIKDWYASHLDDLKLKELALSMGRSHNFICRKAGALGLTKLGRKPSWMIEAITDTIVEHGKTEIGIKQRNEALEKAIYICKTNHPKGMLGKTHSEKYKKQFSERVKKYWQDITPERLEAQMDKQVETKKRNGTLNPMINQSAPYSRARGGRRQDINNQYFRSSWEANIARYYNFMGIKWVYEPKQFIFESIKRGCISYTPDFYLPVEDKWVEIKGWMDDKSKTKLARFKKYYPQEYEKLEIIGSKEYKEFKKYEKIIPNWE
jgi:hypothetical protein